MMKMTPEILIFSGFAGSGKGTVLAIAREMEPRLKLSVSMTTRAPRPGEVNGREYTFATREEFDRTLAEDGFLEHAEYSGNCYGTPKKQFYDMVAAGFIPVLEIETQGALKAMEKLENYVSVFLTPPDFATVEARLRGRATESEADIQKRLRQARAEAKRIPRYQHVVLNLDGRAEDAARAIVDLVRTGESESPVLVRDREAFLAGFLKDE